MAWYAFMDIILIFSRWIVTLVRQSVSQLYSGVD